MPEFYKDHFVRWTTLAFRSNWTIRDVIAEEFSKSEDAKKVDRAMAAYTRWIDGGCKE